MAAGSIATRRAWRHAPARKLHFLWYGGPVQKPGPASPANMSKRGLFARLYVPNQTLIMVNARLPKGNFARGNEGGTAAWTPPGQAKTPASGQLVSRAGTPTAVHPAGTSWVTTDP